MTHENNIETTIRAAVDSLPLWIACGDAEGKYFFANKYYTTTFGIPVENIIGHNFREIFPPPMYEKHKRMYDECISSGKSVTFEDKFEFADGRVIHTYGVYTPLVGSGGNIYGVSAAAFDITDKKELELKVKKADEELRKSEEKISEWARRYECIVAASGQIAYDYEVATGEILWGSTIEQVLGYACDEINKGFAQWVELLHPDDKDITLAKLDEAEKKLSLFDAEYRMRHKKGHYVWVHDRGFFVADASGKAARQLGMIEDVTERKKADDAILKAAKEAEAANRAKSMFLANISHEIRTPMNGIVGFTNLLRKSGLTPEQMEFVDIIKSSCNHLLGLIDDLLDFSKIEAKKLKLESAPFDVRASIEESVKFVSRMSEAKNIDLKSFFDEGITRKVYGDQLRFRQIAINLLTNAIKFTPENGVVSISVSEISSGNETVDICVEVHDTGIGIPAEKIGEIFEMFHQLDESSTKRHAGSGIGLSIVKGLAELMGGSVLVESEVGKGSAFKVTLPFKKVRE